MRSASSIEKRRRSAAGTSSNRVEAPASVASVYRIAIAFSPTERFSTAGRPARSAIFET